jgi:hypothetical protein
MSKFINAAIPFATFFHNDGKVYRCITDKQIVEDPILLDFINRFPQCFQRSETNQLYIYKEPQA